MLKKISLWFILWRIALFLLAIIAPYLLIYQPSFPYADSLLPNTNLPQWLYSFANFDGVHYLTIANKGYIGTGLIQAFFPVYPYLIRILSFKYFSLLLTGLTISNLSAWLLLILWFASLKKIFNTKIANLGILVLIFSPTSFFLGSLYNESLFLSLILACFLASKKKHWLLAGLFAGLASATRVVGIFSLLIIVIEAWQSLGKKMFKNWQIYLSLILASSGLMAYMWFLKTEFDDYLYFLHVQNQFGAGRQSQLILFPQVIWRYSKILLTARPINWKYYSYVQDLIISLGGCLILLKQIYQIVKEKKLNSPTLSLLIFSTACFFLPSLTGTFSSMPRYLLACPSIFIFIANWLHQHSKWQILYFSISIGLLIINTILFIQGYWVA